jgi:hypothetical protein
MGSGMEHDETDDLSPKRIQRLLQESILRNYPNPERRGCPGDPVLRRVASERFSHQHGDWQHITHCSPCYQEFLELRLQVRDRQTRYARLALATAVLGLLVIAAAIWVGVFQRSAPKTPIRTQNAPPQREVNSLTAVLNMEGVPSTRSVEPSPTPKSQNLQRLPRARISTLIIYLPFGSPVGIYQVHLVSGDGAAQSALATFAAAAETKEGLTVLKLSPDLSTYVPGIYTISVLRDGASLWSCQFRLS